MDIIALLLGFVLLTATVFYIASPLRASALPGSAAPAREGKAGGSASPQQRRQSVLLALRDLDFDFQAGKVTEEDYTRLRADLLSEAAELLEASDRSDAAIEALIASRRSGRANGSGAGGKDAPAPERRCSHCQAVLGEDAKFCAQCGAAVNASVCAKCQHPLQADDRFCPVCGTAVPVVNGIGEVKGD